MRGRGPPDGDLRSLRAVSSATRENLVAGPSKSMTMTSPMGLSNVPGNHRLRRRGQWPDPEKSRNVVRTASAKRQVGRRTVQLAVSSRAHQRGTPGSAGHGRKLFTRPKTAALTPISSATVATRDEAGSSALAQVQPECVHGVVLRCTAWRAAVADWPSTSDAAAPAPASRTHHPSSGQFDNLLLAERVAHDSTQYRTHCAKAFHTA